MAEGIDGVTGRQAEVINDIGIAEAYRPRRLGSVVMSELWDKVRCPTLVLRGADPDMPPLSTAREMTGRGPRAELVEFAGVGHLPALLTREQVAPIAKFLERSTPGPRHIARRAELSTAHHATAVVPTAETTLIPAGVTTSSW